MYPPDDDSCMEAFYHRTLEEASGMVNEFISRFETSLVPDIITNIIASIREKELFENLLDSFRQRGGDNPTADFTDFCQCCLVMLDYLGRNGQIDQDKLDVWDKSNRSYNEKKSS